MEMKRTLLVVSFLLLASFACADSRLSAITNQPTMDDTNRLYVVRGSVHGYVLYSYLRNAAQLTNALPSSVQVLIVQAGTITNGLWQGTVIDEAYLDSDVVEEDENNTFQGGTTQAFNWAIFSNNVMFSATSKGVFVESAIDGNVGFGVGQGFTTEGANIWLYDNAHSNTGRVHIRAGGHGAGEVRLYIGTTNFWTLCTDGNVDGFSKTWSNFVVGAGVDGNAITNLDAANLQAATVASAIDGGSITNLDWDNVDQNLSNFTNAVRSAQTNDGFNAAYTNKDATVLTNLPVTLFFNLAYTNADYEVTLTGPWRETVTIDGIDHVTRGGTNTIYVYEVGTNAPWGTAVSTNDTLSVSSAYTRDTTQTDSSIAVGNMIRVDQGTGTCTNTYIRIYGHR